MLTRNDLKDIKTLVSEIVVESENRIKTELRDEFKSEISQVSLELIDFKKVTYRNFGGIKKDLDDFKKETQKDLKEIWDELKLIRESLNATINYFDGQLISIKGELKQSC